MGLKRLTMRDDKEGEGRREKKTYDKKVARQVS